MTIHHFILSKAIPKTKVTKHWFCTILGCFSSVNHHDTMMFVKWGWETFDQWTLNTDSRDWFELNSYHWQSIGWTNALLEWRHSKDIKTEQHTFIFSPEPLHCSFWHTVGLHYLIWTTPLFNMNSSYISEILLKDSFFSVIKILLSCGLDHVLCVLNLLLVSPAELGGVFFFISVDVLFNQWWSNALYIVWRGVSRNHLSLCIFVFF